MGALDKIQYLGLKRRVVESILNDDNKEDIADRIILLLAGDTGKIDMLVSGVPYDLANPVDRVNLEKYIREEKKKRITGIREVVFTEGAELCVRFNELDTVYLKPDNTEGAERIRNGGPTYCESTKWSKSEEYSMACDYEVKTDMTLRISDLEVYGIEFKKL